MSQSSVSRVNGWCQLSVSSLWTFSRNGATRPPICHSDVLQVWYTYLQNQIDLYMSTLWISDHHAPPNLKQYIAQESCSKPECAFYIIKQRNLDQMHLCICVLLHFVNFLNLFCDSYFESPDIFITAAQCYPSMHLFMQFIYIVKLCYKNNKFRTGAETVPIF